MKILVTKRPDDYQATAEKDPTIWGCGDTPREAVGDLIFAHPEAFGVGFVKHDIRLDYVGANNRPRYSCHTCDQQAIVHQPHMDNDDWERAKTNFLNRHHPHTEVKDDGLRE